MRIRTLATAVGLTFLTSLSLPVLAQAPNAKPAAPVAAASSLSGSDKDFLEDSLSSGLAAVEASKLILKKSGNDKLKEFADRLILDQGAVNAELAALQARKGLTPATEPTMLQRTQLKALASLEGADADKMYAKQFGIASQQNNLLDYQNASAKADDADIRAFAKRRLTGFEDRSNLARSLGLTDKGM
jgi:putative membrane protein